MSLDAFSVLVTFFAVVEVALGLTAIVLGVREARAPAVTEAGDERRPLLVLVGWTLLTVALLSLPLFYLLLQSWVPRWSGVMCVAGVRRIGLGSPGAAGCLPALVSAVDVTKLLVVFAAGAWAVLRRLGNVSRKAALALTVLGALAVADGAVETAYVLLPKDEVPADTGCCTMETMAASSREEGLTAAGAADGDAKGVSIRFFAVAVLLAAGAAVVARRGGAATSGFVAVLAAASLPLALSFLADVAAPAVLRLPFHHCVWCAYAGAPETIAGAALYVGSVCCAGWALVARLVDADAPPARRLFGFASFGFLASALFGASVLHFA